jgi:hypothetical protein
VLKLTIPVMSIKIQIWNPLQTLELPYEPYLGTYFEVKTGFELEQPTQGIQHPKPKLHQKLHPFQNTIAFKPDNFHVWGK